MNWIITLPIVISALALLPSLYAFGKTWKQNSLDKSDVVFKNAVTLIEQNQKQADTLQKQLTEAHQTIDDITEKLYTANRRADKLASDLVSANIEIIQLRAQIKSMSEYMDGETSG